MLTNNPQQQRVAPLDRNAVAESGEDEYYDEKKIGYLIRNEDRADIELFLENFPALATEYIPVAVIGEGKADAFSGLTIDRDV